MNEKGIRFATGERRPLARAFWVSHSPTVGRPIRANLLVALAFKQIRVGRGRARMLHRSNKTFQQPVISMNVNITRFSKFFALCVACLWDEGPSTYENQTLWF